MASPLALVWELIARDNASATFNRVGDSAAVNAEKTAAFTGGLAKIGEAIGLAGVAVAAVSLKMAADYQSTTTKLVTTAGESKDAIGMVSQGMLDMSTHVGISAQKLSEGMYIVESAGYHDAEALNVLKASAEGAAQEHASLEHVADAVSTALHDYHLPASDAADVTSKLITAVSHGKTNFDEFTGALHSVTPIASAAGISLADATGVLASMTASGISAQQAAENLGSTIKRFSGGGLTQPMIQELGAVGISAQDLVNNLGDGPGKTGLAATLEKVSRAIMDKMGPSGTLLIDTLNQSQQAGHDAQRVFDALPPAAQKVAEAINNGTLSYKDFRKAGGGLAVEQRTQVAQWATLHDKATGFSTALKSGSIDSQNYVAALAKATGGQEALSVMLQTTGQNAEATAATIKDISGATSQADGNIKGWDEVQGTFNLQLQNTINYMKKWLIELGQNFLPKATEFLTWLQSAVKWMGEHQDLMMGIAKAVGVAAAGLVTYAAATKTAAAATAIMTAVMDANPVVRFATVLATLTAAFVTMYHTNSQFHDQMQPIADFFKERMPTAIKGTQDAMTALQQGSAMTSDGFDKLGSLLSGSFLKSSNSVGDNLKALGSIFGHTTETGIKPATDATDKAKEASDQLSAAQSKLNDALQQGADKYQILNKGALDQSTANDALAKAENALTDSVHQNGNQIDGNTTSALANRDAVKTAIQALSDKVQADYTANLSTMTLTQAQDAARLETDQGKEALIRIAGQLGITGGAFDQLTSTIHAVPTQHDIDVTNNALASQNAIDLLSSSIHTIPAQTKIAIDIAAGQQLNKDAGFTNGPNADGNIYTAFANGGVENHVAQIAGKSGHGRLWAEDETGGESYIPLSPHKRERSLDIWHQTGKLLGAFADGGITSGVDINVVTDLSKAMAAVKAETSARQLAASGGPPGSMPAGDLAGWEAAALGILGKDYGTFAPGLTSLIMNESGGNPNAINLTDSNAVAGHPSKGLMQTIDGTFAAYALPGYGNIYAPVDNILAGFRYAEANYGDQMIIGGGRHSGGSYVGYDEGGLLMPGYSQVYNGHSEPEIITPPGAGQFGGGKDVTINVYSLPGQSGEQIAHEVKRQLLFEMR